MVINFNSALVQSSLTGGFVSGSKTNTGQSILGGSTGEGVESGLSTRNILNRIQDIQDTNLVGSTGFQFNNVQVPLMNLQTNQIALGQSSIDASRAINEQIAIREAQRKADLGFSSQIQDQLNAHVESVNTASGSSAAGSSDSFFDGFPALPSLAQLKTPLIIAGAALAAVIILPRLIKGGFK
jgi:hypothetical protein